MRKLFKGILPIYIKLWPTYYWIALWSAPNIDHGETDWQALRITLRKGLYHSELLRVFKAGII